MVFCTYCGHSFTRDEHLERHILTHTNVKPFKCFTCHMSFARRDLLQRHYTVHGKTQDQQEVPAANGMMLKSAGRTPIACSNCAKTKTKCDKKFPCTRCATRNLKCTLRPTRRSTKNAARMGLITPETLAAGLVGEISAEHTIIPSNECDHEHDEPDLAHEHEFDHDSDQCSSPPVAVMTNSSNSSRSSPRSSTTTAHSQTGSQDDLEVKAGSFASPTRITTSPVTPVLEHDFTNPFSAFHDQSAGKSLTTPSSPRFMLDWQQLQMPMDYDPLAHGDLVAEADLNLDLSSMALDTQVDPMNMCYTEFGQMAADSLITPIETPVHERSLSSFELNPVMAPGHDRHSSLISTYSNESLSTMSHQQHSSLANIDPVLIAQSSWTAFRCVPGGPVVACPTTARWNLETLESSLKDHEGWSSWTPDLGDLGHSSLERLSVMKLHESTRDKLLAITQGFLHKALEIHRGSTFSPNVSPYALSDFVLLPPARVLEFFLRSYSNSFERNYSISSRSTLDINELMHCYNDKASSLLVLLMVAEGAMGIPSVESRALTLGLVEACRISLFDLIERNVHMASERNVLHAALIFTSVAAWGGDKWQMDIAMGQRGIYTAMLRHTGMLKGATPIMSGTSEGHSTADQLWNVWIGQESHSRLVYGWAMIDQELALFHDTAPLLSVTEFEARLPHEDDVWHAKTAGEWSSAMKRLLTRGAEASHPPSLHDLFRSFLDDEMDSIGHALTATHIRLLLHCLQGMVCHYSQLMSCFTDSGSSRAKTTAITASSTRCRVEEVQSLLHRWFTLATKHSKGRALCPIMHNALILYHLICLNTCTSFTQIEQLARRESFDGTYSSLMWAHKRSISDVGEAIFHCGQTLRLVRALPRANRPPWWAAAVYRAGLILWCDSLINKESHIRSASQALAIDALPADHPAILRYLNKGDGTPCLTRLDGKSVSIDHGVAVLEHIISVLDEGVPTRFQEGIRAKLELLMRS